MVSIYALINPINNQVFYIGATYDIDSRYRNHVNEKKGTTFKCQVINEIRANNKKPEILVLDKCQREEVSFLEEFYIDLFSYYGFELNQQKSSTYSEMYRHSVMGNITRERGFKMPDSVYNAFSMICKQEGHSKSDIITNLIHKFLKRYINDSNENSLEVRNELLDLYGLKTLKNRLQ